MFKILKELIMSFLNELMQYLSNPVLYWSRLDCCPKCKCNVQMSEREIDGPDGPIKHVQCSVCGHTLRW